MSKRSYRQNCALARAGDVIGERWTILLMRDLLIAPRRFNELLASLKGIGTNLLAARLKALEAAEIIERRSGAEGATYYAATESGRALEPALLALIRWSMVYGPANKPGDHHRADWDLLALKAVFRPELAHDLSVCAQFVSSDFEGWVRISNGEIGLGVGETEDSDVRIDGTIADLFVGAKTPRELLVDGRLDALERFMSVFRG